MVYEHKRNRAEKSGGEGDVMLSVYLMTGGS